MFDVTRRRWWACGSKTRIDAEWYVIMDIQNVNQVPPFTTKDGSEIRELLAHRNSCIENQSLAEARLPSGASTTPHFHPHTEEIYYILEGEGRMRVDSEIRDVGPGDLGKSDLHDGHEKPNLGHFRATHRLTRN